MATQQPSRTTQVTGADITQRRSVPMRRPPNAVGRIGQRITVETNFFPIKAPRLTQINQLSVEILAMRDTDPSPRNVRRGKSAAGNPGGGHDNREEVDIAPTAFMEFNRSVISAFCKAKIPNIKLGYDGRKMAYSAVELPPGVLDELHNVPVDRDGFQSDPEKMKEEVKVRIRNANVINVRSLINGSLGVIEAGAGLSAIDSVLACSPLQSHVQVGRSFFHHSGENPLGGGVMAWRGFYQSARLSQRGLLLNMDESRTPFWDKGGRPLADIIKDVNRGQPVRAGNDRANKEVTKILQGLKVKAIHTNITYRLHGFSRSPASQHTFFDETHGRDITVKQYLLNTYNVTLRDNQGLCVITNPKKGTMVPIELLYVVSRQRLAKAMTPEQTSNMIRCAATKPDIRRKGAISAIERVKHNADPTCKAFGIQIDSQMMRVPARVLPAPMINYWNNQPVEPRFGAWNARHNMKLFKPAPCKLWTVLNLSRARENEVMQFVDQLRGYARTAGMIMAEDVPYYQAREHDAEKSIKRIVKDFAPKKRWADGVWRLQLILVIKNKQDTQIYNSIKKLADLDAGVATQVMLSKHLQKPRGMDMYCGNLLLKINAKLGGQNSIAVSPKPNTRPAPPPAFMQKKYIILGADVTHPSGGGARPSVAALVGSKDRLGIQFTGSLRNMPPRQELMTCMGEQFMEVFTRWQSAPDFRNSPELPDSIIMFRDGVSEGQFEQVMETELEAIRRKCFEKRSTWNPKITYIIVTKRHHARFFPGRNDAERSGNIPPGTVIDTDIVSNQYYDFYMNTHSGIQGTSRPSKYTVLLDENKIPIDQLQGFIYRLTHNYVRCNRSVSIVNAAYYAHLLAFRGRAYLGDESDAASATGSEGPVFEEYQPLHAKLGNRLFFV